MTELSEFDQYLINRVYNMTKDGLSMPLYTLLSNLSSQQIDMLFNQQKVRHLDGQRGNPLIIAARDGHHNVVRMLIDKFKPELEQEGTVKFGGVFISGASSLWCAAGAGHLNIVKTLVKAGADVNHATHTNSTPLRAACFEGSLDIVSYLVEHGADIHTANKENNTCLMIAAYKGHVDIANFLLDHGADPNEKTLCGTTALHFAAESGHWNIVSKLLEYGAKMVKNSKGMTPLTVAAEYVHENVVEKFIEENLGSKEDVIDAYELLGASFANDKDYYCLPKAYSYFHKAMVLRYSDPLNIIRKKLGDPVPAYENWRESETLEKLESLKHNSYAIQMESLAIRERILGVRNLGLPYQIVYRGAVLADNARFDRCIDLWLHALKLKQKNNISVMKDLLRFAQVFSQIMNEGKDIQYCHMMGVLESILIELERNKLKIKNPDAEGDPEQYQEEAESNIVTTLYILHILVKLIALNINVYNDAQIDKLHFQVRRFCALRMTMRDGQTLLHLAVNGKTPVDDFYTNEICKFPCPETTRLLIECGADVNAMDNERNTPLHVIANYFPRINDSVNLYEVMTELLNNGAHIDTVNSEGETPYDATVSGGAEKILFAQTNARITLKCMAAKIIKSCNLLYTGKVPSTLWSFIELHGSG